MVLSIGPTGTSARIIAFPNSAPQPVQQTRRPGRWPACVVPAYKVNNKRQERRKAGIAIQVQWLTERGLINKATGTQRDNAEQAQKRAVVADRLRIFISTFEFIVQDACETLSAFDLGQIKGFAEAQRYLAELKQTNPTPQGSPRV